MPETALNYDYLGDKMYVALLVLLFMSSVLSIDGSLSSIIFILRKKRLREVYHRLIFGMSVADLLVSLSLLFLPFFGRQDLGLPLAIGNTRTCDAVGFVFQFYVASSFYNAILSLYFVSKIIYNQSDRQISSRFEPYIHILPFLLSVVFGILGVAFRLFNTGYLIPSCDFWHYPADCAFDNDVECERGDKTLGFVIGYSVGIFHMLAATFAVAGTWTVYHYVQRQLDHTSSLSFDVVSAEARYRRRLRVVMWNSILYTAVFLNTFIVAVVCTGLQNVVVHKIVNDPGYEIGNGTVIFARLFCYMLFPLQGFLNWMVYIRNRVARIKRTHHNRSWWWAYRHVYCSSALQSSRNASVPRAVSPDRSNIPYSQSRDREDSSDKRRISLWDADPSSSLDEDEKNFFERLRRENMSVATQTVSIERLNEGDIDVDESVDFSASAQRDENEMPSNGDGHELQ